MAQLDAAKSDTQKTFADGRQTGSPVAPCFAAGVTVRIVAHAADVPLETDVACPGHPHMLTAIGDPGGGTYEWTVSAGAKLVDSGGDPATTGNSLFLRGFQPDHNSGKIPARNVPVGVKYTHPNGTARASKRITIHAIDFVVTNQKVDRGWTQAFEGNNGIIIRMTPGLPTVWTTPQVEIRLDSKCPRKAACAGNHRVGWLQTVRAYELWARYTHTKVETRIPTPIRDKVNVAGVPVPFYRAPVTFTRDRNKQRPHFEDSPGMAAPWADPRPNAPPPPPAKNRQLRKMKLSNSFTAWLVAQNIEWSEHDRNHSFAFLKNFDWSCGLEVQVDTSKPVGNRVVQPLPPRRRPTVGPLQNGKGSRNPELTISDANTAANYGGNQHVGGAPGI